MINESSVLNHELASERLTSSLTGSSNLVKKTNVIMSLLNLWLQPSNVPLVIQLLLPVVAYLFTYNYTIKNQITVDKGYLVSVFMTWFFIGLLINGYFTLVKF